MLRLLVAILLTSLLGCGGAPGLRPVSVRWTDFTQGPEAPVVELSEHLYVDAHDHSAERTVVEDAEGAEIRRVERTLGPGGFARLELTWIGEQLQWAVAQDWDEELALQTRWAVYAEDPDDAPEQVPSQDYRYSWGEDGVLDELTEARWLVGADQPASVERWKVEPPSGRGQGSFAAPALLPRALERFTLGGELQYRLSGVFDAQGGPTLQELDEDGDGTVEQTTAFQSTWDDAGRLLGYRDCAAESCAETLSLRAVFTYDELGQLARVDSYSTTAGVEELVETWVFRWSEVPVTGVMLPDAWRVDPLDPSVHLEDWCVTEWDGLVQHRRCYGPEGWQRSVRETAWESYSRSGAPR